MSETQRPYPAELSRALGQIPSGLYVLTARRDDRETGMLASWVQQAGFEPPMVTVAIKKDRFVVDWIETSRRFTLNQLPQGSKALIRHFSRGFEPEAHAFEGVPIERQALGGPVVQGAMSFLDVEVVARLEEADHCIFLARIVGGDVLDADAKPFLHVRANGFHY